ncbi:hypothetical protein NP493_1435g01023 [Ridgeia piscesae]|uniref:Uncharacterized protein n=1 Tax=Ridgeia piscesae TaxID=27915 RepID=A0AAD9K4S6_RIDPI|nr:hypothetical protein NP493_1435g01023 [Ridgeia piscesae]
MIDDGAKTETIDEIFIVGGTHETTSDVSAVNIKKKHRATNAEGENLDTNHHGEQRTPVEASSQSRSTGRRQHENEGSVQRSRRQIRRQRPKISRNGLHDAAFQRDGLHLSESGVGRLLLNLSLPEQPPKQNKRQHQQQHRHVSNATKHDRLPNARVAPDGNLTVVKRRTRLSMGKCPKCGETNHVTATCRHPDKVLFCQWGKGGQKKSITPVIRKWA